MAPPVKLRIKLRSAKRETSSQSTPQTTPPSVSSHSEASVPARILNITLRSTARADSTHKEDQPSTSTGTMASVHTTRPRTLNTTLRSTSRADSTHERDQPSTSTGTTTSHRQKLKIKDPEAYKLLLLEDAEKARQYRKSWTKYRKQQEREASKFRMQQLRDRRKKEAEEIAKTKPPPKPTRKTRAEKKKEAEELEKKREKNRDYQRKRRANFSEAKKEEIKAMRREKRKEEKEQLLEYRRLIKKAKEEEEERNDGPRSVSARRKSLSRARAGLPKNPEAFADTIEDLQQKASPRKAAVLKDRGFSVDQVDQLITRGLKQRLQSLKAKRCRKDRAMKRELLSILHLTKKYNLQRKTCQKLKVTNKNIRSNPIPFSYRNAREVSEVTKAAVTKFYEDNSVELPDQKGVSKKTLKKTRALEKPIRSLHAAYLSENPQHQVGLTSFFALRPPHVRKIGDVKFRGCLCEYCENVTLKLKAYNGACSKQKMQAAKLTGISEVVNLTMCPKTGKFHKKTCIERKCPQCGVESLSTHVQDLDLEAEVTWQFWDGETRQIPTKSGEQKTITRKERKNANGTLGELIELLKKDLAPLSEHLFNKGWQQQQFSHLVSNKLPDGYCALVMDFAENYTCKVQNEVQSAHWTQEQVTLHPIIGFYNCPSPRCDKPIMHSFVFISNDLNHDHHAVHVFSSQTIKMIKDEYSQPLTKVVRFSDGCTSQYKSKGPFLDISYSIADNNVPIQHEFFGSRHGKGPSDGESAVIKRMTSMADLSNQASITNAHDMYQYCSANLTRKESDDQSCLHFKRTVVYVPREEIDHKRIREGKTLTGTRKIHSIKCVKPGVVAWRNVSCFCRACIEGVGVCANTDYVDDWKVSKIEKTQDTTTEKTKKMSNTIRKIQNKSIGKKQKTLTKAQKKHNKTKTSQTINLAVNEGEAGLSILATSVPLVTSDKDDTTNMVTSPSRTPVPTETLSVPQHNLNLDGYIQHDNDGVVNSSTMHQDPVLPKTSTGRPGISHGDGDNQLDDDGIADTSTQASTSTSPSESIETNASIGAAGCKYKSGDYVAVIYDESWWAGQIIKSEEGRCTINYMVRKGENKFTWPDKKEQDLIGPSGIFARFPAPPAPVSSRYMGFDEESFQTVEIGIQRYLQENKK